MDGTSSAFCSKVWPPGHYLPWTFKESLRWEFEIDSYILLQRKTSNTSLNPSLKLPFPLKHAAAFLIPFPFPIIQTTNFSPLWLWVFYFPILQFFKICTSKYPFVLTHPFQILNARFKSLAWNIWRALITLFFSNVLPFLIILHITTWNTSLKYRFSFLCSLWLKFISFQ